MSSQTTVLIPMKKYMRKYLVKVYGAEPIVFPHGHLYNRYLIRHLSKPPKDYKPSFDRENCIEIVLPFNHLVDVTTCFHLSVHDLQKFRYEIDQDFFYDYIKFIADQMKQGFNRKQATTLCMALYDIDECDITHDAFYKNFYRKAKIRFDLHKSFEIFKNNPQLSIQF